MLAINWHCMPTVAGAKMKGLDFMTKTPHTNRRNGFNMRWKWDTTYSSAKSTLAHDTVWVLLFGHSSRLLFWLPTVHPPPFLSLAHGHGRKFLTKACFSWCCCKFYHQWKAFSGSFYGTVVSGFTVCKDLTVGRPTTHSSNSPKIEHNRNPPTPSSKTLQQGSSLHSPMFFCPTFAPLPDWMKPRCQLWKVGKCPFSQHVEHDCFVSLKSQSWPVYHPSLPTLPQANQHGWLQRHIPKVQSKTKTVMHNGKMHHTCQRPGVHVQQQQFYASCSSIRPILVFDRVVCV